jgi:hypothetical protein
MPSVIATTTISTKKFSNFASSEQLIAYAEDLLQRKLHHLKNDVEDCLLVNSSKTKNAPAPYPAMLFSFSLIDMLGSLYTGTLHDQQPQHSDNNDERSYVYMKNVMGIDPKKASILLQMFRHKLLHFADPKTVLEYQGSRISWSYFHESNLAKHLQLTRLSNGNNEATTTIQIPLTPTKVQADEEFTFGIMDFAQDIKKSVYKRPDGYLEILKNDIDDSQRKFDAAVTELLDYRSYPWES